ncbi:hypothetical protein KUH32_04240 [Thalassococcus sp. CAU 1522]|uniref:Uncharacterized protein n=1 Tax=Thalassococcus arenae TaxID=2851652 RepID=A0ABS6N4P2_9RHOB|nr:hypothetical protein [Thalassococcus arenae]MBV2358975.1 hypothetical protein [Thalassococcus arenae]
MAGTRTQSLPSPYEPLLDTDPRMPDLTRQGMVKLRLDVPPMFYAGTVPGEEMAAASSGGDDTPPRAVLNRHLVSTVAYTRDASGKASFFSALFKAEAKATQVGVIQEAKTFAVVQTEDGRDVEMGIAVRLQVEASRFSSDVQVSIPNIAAEAQLGLSRAEMEISVRGFAGPLGNLLPVPKAVDLTSYADYIESFRRIQEHVFSDTGRDHYSPVALGLHHLAGAPAG